MLAKQQLPAFGRAIFEKLRDLKRPLGCLMHCAYFSLTGSMCEHEPATLQSNGRQILALVVAAPPISC